MKRGFILLLLLVVIIIGITLLWSSLLPPAVSPEAEEECADVPDRMACLKEEQKVQECLADTGTADAVSGCIANATGRAPQESLDCTKNLDLPGCKALGVCIGREESTACMTQQGAGETPVILVSRGLPEQP